MVVGPTRLLPTTKNTAKKNNNTSAVTEGTVDTGVVTVNIQSRNT